MVRTVLASLLLTAGASSCGPVPAPADAPSHDAPARDTPVPIGSSGAICPEGGTSLTWASFGETFFATYCTRCHATSVVGSTARMGAPPDLNWDEHATVMANAARIDRVAAAGPRMVNTFMPINGLVPSEAERRQLAEWLACGAP